VASVALDPLAGLQGRVRGPLAGSLSSEKSADPASTLNERQDAMKLDDKPLLAVLAERGERITSLERMADRACALIATDLEPFEKYCGKVVVSFLSGSKTTITAAWRYRLPCGTKLSLSALLEHQMQGWMMIGKRLAVPVATLSPEAVSAAFVRVNEKTAEAAFEAIVLEEPWQLRHILQ
jgi:hypothetical protein